VVAFNAVTGAPTSFAPNVDGEVFTIAPSCTGTLLFMGGNFHHVNGAVRNYAAKVSVSTSALATWNPNPNGIVEDMSIMRGHLVVDGSFTKIGGANRTNMASLSQTAAAGTADNWLNISVTGHDPAGPQKIRKIAANHRGTYAVMIGNFNTVGGVAHRRMAMLKLTDARAVLTPWATPLTASKNNADAGTDCSRAFPNPERDVDWTPGDTQFWVASTGGAHSGSICDALSKWSGTATASTNPNARPMAIQYTGGDSITGVAATTYSVFTAGHNRWADNPPIYPFKPVTPCSPTRSTTGSAGYNCWNPPSMGGTSVDRPGMFEVNVSNAKATPWNPTKSRQRGMHVAMMITPQGLWIGSDANYVAGQPHNDIVLMPFATPLK
jgi:hypothetical protein